jgi:predicted TIM-barrel fold metal-dependent hydrolase
MALYALADSCSLPVFVHTGIVPRDVYDGFPLYANEESNPVYLTAAIEMYPDINFNAAHWGSSTRRDYDFMDDVFEMMHTYENFYVDLGYTLWLNRKSKKASDEFIQRAIDEGVEHKLLFGSDEMIWPDAITGGINHIKEADYMSDSVKKQILYWNAATFLKLSNEAIAAHFGK